MGFENRKSTRVKLSTQVYNWVDADANGIGFWGSAINVSATGLAFLSAQFGVKGDQVLMEFTLPGQKAALRVQGKVVHCAKEEGAEKRNQWRVNFVRMDPEQKQEVLLYVLKMTEPETGLGHAYFSGIPSVGLKYKEVTAAEVEKALVKREFLAMKEMVYLKNYRELVLHALGKDAQEGLKVLGSRPMKIGAIVWLQLELPMGQLHFLAKTLWCHEEKGEKAEFGLQLTAFGKEEAMKLEKAF